MTDTIKPKITITDNELDTLLSAPSEPVMDDAFTEELLLRLEQREKLLRYIPLAFGLIGAVITSFFIPTDIFQDLTVLPGRESMTAFISSPLALACILSTPLAFLVLRSD